MKKTTNAPMGAKVICVIISLCMLFSLTACNGSSNNGQQGAGMSVTDAPTMSEEHMGIEEPHQEINPGADIATTPEVTDEPTATPVQQDGKYSYTIYGGVVVTMDINIDDYITTNTNGQAFLKLYDVALDCGWVCVDENEYRAYTYDNGGFETYLYYSYHGEEIGDAGIEDVANRHQVETIKYNFCIYGTRNEPYYEDNKTNAIHANSMAKIAQHFNECCYRIPGLAAVSRDDAILLAWMFDSARRHPGENPFTYADFSDYLNGRGSGTQNYELP